MFMYAECPYCNNGDTVGDHDRDSGYHKCENCGLFFKYRIEHVPKTEKVFQCHICNELFEQDEVHLLKKCEICGSLICYKCDIGRNDFHMCTTCGEI